MMMKVNIPISITALLFILTIYTSCIERYYPENYIKKNSKIVVDALISDENENQKIRLSKSNLPGNEEFLPLSNCQVIVKDNNENEFIFTENQATPGTYEGIISLNLLKDGTQLMLYFMTEDGEEYLSDFEEYTPCPEVDSVYHELQYKPTENPDVALAGYQFYVDLIATKEYTKYYRIQIDETWEYHSDWPIKNFYDINDVYQSLPVTDYSLFTCYRISPIEEIFILNTSALEQNQYYKLPLHFVSDGTQRLLYQYSLLIKQYSLSESAYTFWENLKENNQESGGLFDSQPIFVNGNVRNLNAPKEVVLGYFGLSAVKQKRIMIKNTKDLLFKNVPHCSPTKADGRLPDDRPLYFISAYDQSSGETSDAYYAGAKCFDCTLKGGTTEKPDYWDK